VPSLLKEAVPAAVRMAVLWDPDNPIDKLELTEASTAGGTLGLTLLPVEIRTPERLEDAFSTDDARTRGCALVTFERLDVSEPRTVCNWR
jgi:hypothetical protein